MSHPQFAAELIERAKEQGPVTIGLAGAGQMGTDIVVQVALMPGLQDRRHLRGAAAGGHRCGAACRT